jgi:hypothetical protein
MWYSNQGELYEEAAAVVPFRAFHPWLVVDDTNVQRAKEKAVVLIGGGRNEAEVASYCLAGQGSYRVYFFCGQNDHEIFHDDTIHCGHWLDFYLMSDEDGDSSDHNHCAIKPRRRKEDRWMRAN